MVAASHRKRNNSMKSDTAAYAQSGFAPAPAAHRSLERGKPKLEARNFGVDKTS